MIWSSQTTRTLVTVVSSGRREHAVGADAARGELAAEAYAGRVRADHPDQPDLGTEGGQVHRGVGRAARDLQPLVDLDHRGRGLPGQPLAAAAPPAVQDQVADHRDPRSAVDGRPGPPRRSARCAQEQGSDAAGHVSPATRDEAAQPHRRLATKGRGYVRSVVGPHTQPATAPASARRGRVLIARLDGTGDVLLTGGAVRAVAASAASVTMLVDPEEAATAWMLPGVDEVIPFEAGWLGHEHAAGPPAGGQAPAPPGAPGPLRPRADPDLGLPVAPAARPPAAAGPGALDRRHHRRPRRIAARPAPRCAGPSARGRAQPQPGRGGRVQRRRGRGPARRTPPAAGLRGADRRRAVRRVPRRGGRRRLLAHPGARPHAGRRPARGRPPGDRHRDPGRVPDHLLRRGRRCATTSAAGWTCPAWPRSSSGPSAWSRRTAHPLTWPLRSAPRSSPCSLPWFPRSGGGRTVYRWPCSVTSTRPAAARRRGSAPSPAARAWARSRRPAVVGAVAQLTRDHTLVDVREVA